MLAIVRRYLAGEVPLTRILFHDMLLIGTMVNIVAGLATLAAFSLDFPVWAAIAIFLSPVPYNIILCVSVWRSAAREAPRWREIARIVTVIWFPMMLIV